MPSRRFASDAVLSRRNVLTGACAICAASISTAKAQRAYDGCTLRTTEFDERIDGVAKHPSDAVGEASIAPGVFHGSGDPQFDRALSVTLLKISESFSVLPGFAFSERVRLNAFASDNQALGRMDGSVVFGNSLFREIMTRREHPEIGIVSICAHEFGHIAQYKHNIRRILIVNGRKKRLELHADFMAGYFAGRRKLEMPDFPAAVFATTQYSFGDGDYGNPEHHGTSAERGQAVVAGFESAYRARESFATALETGIRHVQRIAL
jgi:hypothetical protein